MTSAIRSRAKASPWLCMRRRTSRSLTTPTSRPTRRRRAASRCCSGRAGRSPRRESYHGRVFEARLHELGAECRAEVSEESRKFAACVSDPNMPDNEKLLRFAALVPDADAAIKPLFELAESIKEDMETKEAIRLFAEDELSTPSGCAMRALP